MKKEIQKYLRHLTEIEYYNDDYEMSMFPAGLFRDELSVTRCTSSAMMIAAKFNGKVFGYQIDTDDNSPIIGAKCGGHDFAIVGDYLVDWWSEYVEEKGRSLLHLIEDKDEIERRYFHPTLWNELEIWPKV